MLILRYLLRETFKSQLAVFLILMAIFTILRFVRILGDATDGDIPASLVVGFLSLYTPILASLVLPLSAYLGILLAHGRLYVESEMAVMRACGISEWYVTRVMLLLSLLLMIVTAVITLYVSPLAAEREQQLREQARNEAGVSSMIPGRFQQTGNRNAVVFVHEIDSNNQLNRVFLSQQSDTDNDRKLQVVYAQTGSVEVSDDGTRHLILHQGTQFEGESGQLDFRKVRFGSYRIQIADEPPAEQALSVVAMPTLDLLKDGSLLAWAEFQWRLAIPLSIPFLVLIAVPLSTVDPRQGRFGKLFPAILLYLGYFLLLMASRRVLEDGKLPASLGLWWVHSLMLVIGSFLIMRERTLGNWLRAFWYRRRA